MNATDSMRSRTLLHWAVYGDDLPLLTAVLGAGWAADVQDYEGWTPVHLATASGRPELVRALVAKPFGRHALDLALLFGVVFFPALLGQMVECIPKHKIMSEVVVPERPHGRVEVWNDILESFLGRQIKVNLELRDRDMIRCMRRFAESRRRDRGRSGGRAHVGSSQTEAVRYRR